MSAGFGQLRESRCGARPAEGAERPEQGGLRFDPRGLVAVARGCTEPSGEAESGGFEAV